MLLSKIVSARYPFVFVDEYQDTSEKVITILMDHVYKAGGIVIGFFGDKMQSIYSDGVGELPATALASLEIIPKEQNYRCSEAVIEVLNKIRTDIQQFAAGDNNVGAAVYINLSTLPSGQDPLIRAKEIAEQRFGLQSEAADTKILFLAHRLIAGKAGYANLWKAYNGRGGFYQGRFQSGEDDVATFFLKKLEPLISAWKSGKAGRVRSSCSCPIVWPLICKRNRQIPLRTKRQIGRRNFFRKFGVFRIARSLHTGRCSTTTYRIQPSTA